MGFMDFLVGDETKVPDAVRNPHLGNTTGLNFGQALADRYAVPGAQIAMAPQDQFRGMQLGFANQLMNQANGHGPSMVQSQLQQATDQNLQNQMAMAASGRGMNAGAAQRLAQNNMAALGQQEAQQSAMLRNQEMLQAQGMLGNTLSQARGQDIGLASSQGQLDLASQGQKDSFGLGLVNAGNQRDLGLMQGQITGGNNAAQLDAESNKRRSFGQFLGNMGQAAAGIGSMMPKAATGGTGT